MTTNFIPIGKALTESIETASAAYSSDTHISGLRTGIGDLDARLGGLQPSELIVIAARTSMGKTALAMNIAANVARARLGNHPARDGAVVGVFSLETKARRIADRILAEQVDIPSNRVRRGMISEADFKTLAEASQLVAELPLFVDDSPALTMADVVDRATALSRENNLGLLIIDYLQLIGGGLKSLAMSLNI